MPADQVPADIPVWEFAAHALSQLLHTLVLATAPRRILVGGGVIEARPALLELRCAGTCSSSLNGYVDLEALAGRIDRYVVPPGLGALAGPLGRPRARRGHRLTHPCAE